MTVDIDCNLSLRVADGLAGLEKLIELARGSHGAARAKARRAFEDFALLIGPLVEAGGGNEPYFEDLKIRMRAIRV